jgi:hypothetical protein
MNRSRWLKNIKICTFSNSNSNIKNKWSTFQSLTFHKGQIRFNRSHSIPSNFKTILTQATPGACSNSKHLYLNQHTVSFWTCLKLIMRSPATTSWSQATILEGFSKPFCHLCPILKSTRRCLTLLIQLILLLTVIEVITKVMGHSCHTAKRNCVTAAQRYSWWMTSSTTYFL